MPVSKKAHHAQLPATPLFLTISVTKLGVSAEKVVATIETPNNHHDMLRPPKKNSELLDPADFEITEMHRFEGNTDPSDEAVLYAIESKDGKLKGIITSAYGMYADSTSSEMLKKLSMHHS